MPLLFGRNRPQFPGMAPRMSKYMTAALPAPPDAVDWTPKAMSSLSNVMLNDQLGDCVIAGLGHVKGVLTGNAGSEINVTNQQITQYYSAIGGYDGSPRTDNGCNEEDAMNYIAKNGLWGVPVLGWMRVDATNPVEVKTAINLFGHIYSGVQLPNGWTNPMPQASGFTWDVAGSPNPRAGHCITHFGYTARGVITSTWGMIGTVTWAALAKYMTQSAGGELYTFVSADMLTAGQQKVFNGFQWWQLVADFNALGGNAVIPQIPPLDWLL